MLAPRFEHVRLWVFEEDLAARMRDTRVNDVFLPGFTLPESVAVENSLPAALDGAEIVLSVTPSHVTRAVYKHMAPLLTPSMLFVSATKGIEGGTLLRMTDVIRDVLRPHFEARVAALSGPTFAREVARGEPTALVAATPDEDLGRTVQRAFSGPTFRVYTNTDPVGVELAASLKNVIAIGAGVCTGLGLGNNTLAALITRGLAEITRLAVARGGQPLTLAGLAGLGDLVLTCTGELSRNRQVGMELGRGRTLEDIIGSMRMIAEGVKTTHAAVELASRMGVEMPITAKVQTILDGKQSAQEAIRDLMERSLKGE